MTSFTHNRGTNPVTISKLGYLQGYLSEKMRSLIANLPYTAAGYQEAKAILKQKYGRPAEIVKGYVKEISGLTNPGRDVKKIHEFADQLRIAVQGLKTLGKLQEMEGMAQTTLEKLSNIKNGLIGNQEDFEEWGYEELLKALDIWMRKNPDNSSKVESSRVRDYVKHRKVFNTTRQSIRNGMCVYCETKNHRTAECPAVCDVAERRQVLVNKRLCFNCTKPDHRASSCPSNQRCRKCSRKHHTSIFTAGNESHEAMESDTKGKAMTASVNCEGLLPIVVVTINGVQCQALINCGACSSYASHTILNMLNLKPFKTEFKTIEMMLTSKQVRLRKYHATVANIN